MKHTLVVLCALFLCVAVPCAAQNTTPHMGASNAMHSYAQTLVTGTPAQIAAFYDAHGQLLLPGTLPLTGPKEVEAFLTPLVKQAKVTAVSVSVEHPLTLGSPQTLFGTYTQTFVVGTGKPQTVTGRFASLWQKDSVGDWKIVRLMMQPAPIDTVMPTITLTPAK